MILLTPTALILLISLSTINGCLLENGRSSVYLSVFEDLKPGESVGNIDVEGFGGDAGIELRVVKGNDVFTIPEGTNTLKLLTPLDRDEGSGKMEAVVECKSHLESDFSQLNISVFVTVKDVNDNAPEFDQPEYHVNISEELPVGTIVFTDIEAVDKDQPGPNSFLHYSILPSLHSDLLAIVDPFKPVVTVKDRIDFEKVKNFTVDIEARDQGSPSRASVVPLHVTVLDQNDLNPVFEYQYYTARTVKDGVLVVKPKTVTARDGDALNSQINYVLSGELSSHFAIDRDGQIRVRSNPPPPTAVFFVHAIEEQNPDRNATALLKVQLGSVIHFEHDLYNIKIASTTPQGTVLLRPKAYTDSSARLKYSIGSTNGIATIDSNTGTIIMGELPMQLQPFYELNVTASDGTDSTTSRLHVFVDAVTDCTTGPQFESSEYQWQVEALPAVAALRVNMEHSSLELLNMRRDFSIAGDGTFNIRQGANPQCVVCEIVIMAKDQQGRVGFTKVIIKNSAFVLSTSSVLTILILVVIAFIVTISLVFICRKVSYVWRQNKRQRMCWLNQSTDSGVMITGTITGSNRYVVNADKETRPEHPSAKSPGAPRTSGAHLVPVTITNQDGAPTVYF